MSEFLQLSLFLFVPIIALIHFRLNLAKKFIAQQLTPSELHVQIFYTGGTQNFRIFILNYYFLLVYIYNYPASNYLKLHYFKIRYCTSTMQDNNKNIPNYKWPNLLMSTEILVSGTPEGYDAKIILNEIKHQGNSVIHIARDDNACALWAMRLNFLNLTAVFEFPSWDCLPYDRVSPNLEISSARMGILSKFADNIAKEYVVLTTLNAVLQKVPCSSVVKSYGFKAVVGRNI